MSPKGGTTMTNTTKTIRIEGQADGSWVVRDATANIVLAKFGALDFMDARAYVNGLAA
jgi:hypothetical protein